MPSMCPGHRPSPRQHAILRDSLAVALANAKLQDVLVNSTDTDKASLHATAPAPGPTGAGKVPAPRASGV